MATFDQSSVSVDAVSWTAVTPPVDCDNVLISNLQGSDVLKVRRQSGVAQEVKVPAGGERAIGSYHKFNSGVDYRFPSSAVAFYVQFTSGSATVEFIWS